MTLGARSWVFRFCKIGAPDTQYTLYDKSLKKILGTEETSLGNLIWCKGPPKIKNLTVFPNFHCAGMRVRVGLQESKHFRTSALRASVLQLLWFNTHVITQIEYLWHMNFYLKKSSKFSKCQIFYYTNVIQFIVIHAFFHYIYTLI